MQEEEEEVKDNVVDLKLKSLAIRRILFKKNLSRVAVWLQNYMEYVWV